MTGNGKPRLSVFKGREAKLNRDILQVLSLESSLNIRQVYKKVRTHKGLEHTQYRVVNRRIKILEKEGYVKLIKIKKTPQGLIAKHYEPTTKTYFVLALEAVDFDAFIQLAEETELTTLLAAIISITMDLS